MTKGGTYMLMTVEKLRQYITTNESDAMLEERLNSMEHLIRKLTNNNFQNRNVRYLVNIIDGCITCPCDYLKAGDTLQLSGSAYNPELVTVIDIHDGLLELKEDLYNESNVMVTKVVYPPDIRMGAVRMIQWDMTNGKKTGIQSETISRHSVTYFNMDGENTKAGYPKSLCGYLKPYMKARF